MTHLFVVTKIYNWLYRVVFEKLRSVTVELTRNHKQNQLSFIYKSF